MPSQIWICAPGKDPPDWIVERMTTADIAADGSFEIEASDGLVRVERGFAVFEAGDQFFACPPKMVQQKLGVVAPAHPAVVELQHKAQAPATKPPKKADATLRLKPVIGSPPAPQFAAISDLLVDDTYQRSIEGGSSQKLIRTIATNWDWRLCMPLLVSRRDGKLYVIDGQHRKEGAELRGDIAHLPVVVFDFDDPKAEAELFMQANRSRRSMGLLDDFHAAVVAGDPQSVEINEIVEAAGLKVARHQAWQMLKPGEVVFVKAIARAKKSFGREVPETALGVIASAFAGLTLTSTGAIFDALCTMIAEGVKAGAPIDLPLIQRVLTEVGIPGWKEVVAAVDSGFDRTEAMLKALREAYAEARGE
jgi:hypothetical protein